MATDRVFLNAALFRHVLQVTLFAQLAFMLFLICLTMNYIHLIQCGHLDCVQFAGRNDRREAAIAKLKSHWQKEHESSEQVFN